MAQSVCAGEKEDRNDNDDDRNNRPHSVPSSPGSLKLFEMCRELMPVLGSCSVKNRTHLIAAAAEGQEAFAQLFFFDGARNSEAIKIDVVQQDGASGFRWNRPREGRKRETDQEHNRYECGERFAYS